MAALTVLLFHLHLTDEDVYVKPLSGVGKVSVKRTYPTPDSCLTHLFHGRGRSVV